MQLRPTGTRSDSDDFHKWNQRLPTTGSRFLFLRVSSMLTPMINWPEGKQFAWTSFDDTDYASLESLQPIYALLNELGFRTTKSVWPIAGDHVPVCGGLTCEDAAYLAWVRQLQQRGFEIGYHTATYHSSLRAETMRGLARFTDLFGHSPKSMANHSSNRENLYWGSNRLSSWRKGVYQLAAREFSQKHEGELQGSPYFWGDLCKAQVEYVRNFVFADINTLAQCPMMPYHDPDRPLVNWWFASSEGADADSFARTLCEANQDRLAAEGGACIMYTHLAVGFVQDGVVRPDIQRLLRRLASLNGWFVPVGQLLDFLKIQNGGHQLTASERSDLEWRWLRHKLQFGRS